MRLFPGRRLAAILGLALLLTTPAIAAAQAQSCPPKILCSTTTLSGPVADLIKSTNEVESLTTVGGVGTVADDLSVTGPTPSVSVSIP